VFEQAENSGDAILIVNTDRSLKECKAEQDALELFKKDLATETRHLHHRQRAA
jgi:type I restriction enzyme R subunit